MDNHVDSCLKLNDGSIDCVHTYDSFFLSRSLARSLFRRYLALLDARGPVQRFRSVALHFWLSHLKCRQVDKQACRHLCVSLSLFVCAGA